MYVLDKEKFCLVCRGYTIITGDVYCMYFCTLQLDMASGDSALCQFVAALFIQTFN